MPLMLARVIFEIMARLITQNVFQLLLSISLSGLSYLSDALEGFYQQNHAQAKQSKAKAKSQHK